MLLLYLLDEDYRFFGEAIELSIMSRQKTIDRALTLR
jgi:hypothetical protein